MKLFNEEQVILARLLEEWYAELKVITEEANGIFSAKAQQYDKSSPVWERIKWPTGFVQELRKKTDRVSQLLETDKSFCEVIEDVNEELIDIMNYSRMFAALNNMVADREDFAADHPNHPVVVATRPAQEKQA